MERRRNNYTPEEIGVILKRHLVDNVSVLDLCDQYKLNPTVIYRWQKAFFQHNATHSKKRDLPQKRKEVQRIKILGQKCPAKLQLPRRTCTYGLFSESELDGAPIGGINEICGLEWRHSTN